jgi:tRNA-Thr(GGU) m(6)t(6)A37 methyltransferase TsaA
MVDRSDITLKPIGVVRSQVKATPRPEHDWRGVISEIVVNKEFTPGLEGLERSSHIIVIYWAYKATDSAKMALQVHYKGDPELPMVGVFASRSLFRPNPIGQKVAKLLEVEGNVLKVEGLDALDGTPVIDIKPYIPRYDSAQGATAPKWEKHED